MFRIESGKGAETGHLHATSFARFHSTCGECNALSANCSFCQPSSQYLYPIEVAPFSHIYLYKRCSSHSILSLNKSNSPTAWDIAINVAVDRRKRHYTDPAAPHTEPTIAMSDLLTSLGLRSAASAATIPTYAPHFIIGNFVFSYALLSTRGTKFFLGIDNNVSPRDDIAKAAEALRSGAKPDKGKPKVTQEDIDGLRRREAAHANAIENFPLLVGACIIALLARLPNDQINRCALVYTVSRVAYAVAYVRITDQTLSWSRSVLWWVANIACIRLIWFAGKALNGT